MAKPLVSDEFWALVAPLLPPEPPKPKGGRPRLSDRAALTGIIFVLKSGIAWELLPQELGCGSGMTCWRRCVTGRKQACGTGCTRRCWIASGKPTASIGAAPRWIVPASRPKGGPTHRTESNGSRQTGHEAPSCGRPARYPARRAPDRRQPPRLRRLRDPDRRDPTDPTAERSAAQAPRQAPCRQGLRLPRCRSALRRRHIQVRIARKGIDSSKRLGRHRWVVERTLAWLSRFRRLTVRYERRADIHQAFLTLGCALICWISSHDRFC